MPIDAAALRRLFDDELTHLGVKNRRCLLLDFPNHGNVGDSLIWLGETRALQRLNTRIAYAADHRTFPEAAIARADRDWPILLNGGGNFGDLWPTYQEARLRLARRFSDRLIIQLPQSVWFSSPKGELAGRTRDLLGTGRFVLLVRDEASASRARGLGLDARLCPDAALTLDPFDGGRDTTNDVMRILRTDKESALVQRPPDASDWSDAPALTRFKRWQSAIAARVARVSRVGGSVVSPVALWSFNRLAQLRVERGVQLLSGARTIETDRLHCAILALLMGRRVRVVDNVYGKLTAVLGPWRDYLDDVCLQ